LKQAAQNAGGQRMNHESLLSEGPVGEDTVGNAGPFAKRSAKNRRTAGFLLGLFCFWQVFGVRGR
jgi:hypothetical protein